MTPLGVLRQPGQAKAQRHICEANRNKSGREVNQTVRIADLESLPGEPSKDGDAQAVAQIPQHHGNTHQAHASPGWAEPEIRGRDRHRGQREQLIDAAAFGHHFERHVGQLDGRAVVQRRYTNRVQESGRHSGGPTLPRELERCEQVVPDRESQRQIREGKSNPPKQLDTARQQNQAGNRGENRHRLQGHQPPEAAHKQHRHSAEHQQGAAVRRRASVGAVAIPPASSTRDSR